MENEKEKERVVFNQHGWMEKGEVVVKEEEGLFVLLPGCRGGEGGREGGRRMERGKRRRKGRERWTRWDRGTAEEKEVGQMGPCRLSEA